MTSPPGLPEGLARVLRQRREARAEAAEADAQGDLGAAAFAPLPDDPAEAPRIPDPRDRVPRPKMRRVELPDDDPLISGGLLARRTDESARPSLRTALVLTLVLILLLALIAVWSALFLPDSRVAQLLGRVAPEIEAPPELVEAPAPEGVLAPRPGDCARCRHRGCGLAGRPRYGASGCRRGRGT